MESTLLPQGINDFDMALIIPQNIGTSRGQRV
jgi:hypothetical protein